MRTIKVLLIATVLAFANNAIAGIEKKGNSSEELDVTIEGQVDGKVIIGFEKLEDEKVFIQIYDQDKTLIHFEKVTDETLVLKRFDLSRFPAGSYSYKVSNANFTVEKVIVKK
ncbi:MAG: hypothetical protein JXR07_03405 [Reichenbachiella sp.]